MTIIIPKSNQNINLCFNIHRILWFVVALLILWQSTGNAENSAVAEANENDPCNRDPASCVEEHVRSQIANLTNILHIEDFPDKDTLPYKCYLEKPGSIPDGTECVSCLHLGCLPGRVLGGELWDQVCRVYCSEDRLPPKNIPESSPSDGSKRRPKSQDATNNEESKGNFLSLSPPLFLALIIGLLLVIQVLFGCFICERHLKLFDRFISQHKLVLIICIVILIIVALALIYSLQTRK